MLPNYSLPSSQQRNFVVHWNGLYYIDHDAPFGATSAGGVFCRVADAKLAILKSKNIGPSKNWVVISFSLGSQFLYSPLQFFSYSLTEIYSLRWQYVWFLYKLFFSTISLFSIKLQQQQQQMATSIYHQTASTSPRYPKQLLSHGSGSVNSSNKGQGTRSQDQCVSSR